MNRKSGLFFFLIRIVMCSGFGLWGQIPLSTRRGDGVSWLTGSETWNLVEDVFTPIPSTSHARRLSRITIGEGIEAYLSKVGFEIQLRITSFLPFRIHEIAFLTCMLLQSCPRRMGLQGPAKDPHKEMSGSYKWDSNRGSLLRESGTLTTILRLTPLANSY